MGITLYSHQEEAIRKMHNGCILCGGVGSGKSITAIAYYFFKEGGIYNRGVLIPMPGKPIDLYIITTARKRDTLEWEFELNRFLMSTDKEKNTYENKIVIDSWNNVGKYQDVKDAFFIFDEQRVVGSGAWVKAFLKIAKVNQWILLSATPGDTWTDYIPVFLANGFYKNRTEFNNEHVIFSRFTKYPKVDRYVGTKKLERLRHQLLVDMDFQRDTEQHHIDIYAEYDLLAYKMTTRDRWNYTKKEPIVSASELCYEWRRIVNSDDSRAEEVRKIANEKLRTIIFYNFDYELDILKSIEYASGTEIAEWNGHRHETIPKSIRWVYLVQYTAGAEGWNCLETDTIIFYSQNYSYKIMAQAAGRIDRLNTPYKDLYYYHLKSRAPIDIAISRAISAKKTFNENGFVKEIK